MPKAKTRPPENLRPYVFHGVDLTWSDTDENATAANCPFCDGQKFSVQIETSQFQCFSGSCAKAGNSSSFLTQLWAASDGATNKYGDLAKNRNLQSDTLMQWGVVQSIVTGEWLVPGYNAEGILQQLYRNVKQQDGRHRLIPTPTLHHRLHGVNLYDLQKPLVYLCEGPWDAMALWETLRQTKQTEEGLAPTANEEDSLLAEANMLAVPGCNVFLPDWLPLFAGKRVMLMYDSDHPRKQAKTGKLLQPAGYKATQRVAAKLLNCKTPPLEVSYLRWGANGYDKTLTSGYDVRDYLDGGGIGQTSRLRGLEARVERLSGLLGKVYPVPAKWANGAARALRGDKAKSGTNGGDATENIGLPCAPCTSYKKLVLAWRKALKWTSGLDHALPVMLATIASTKVMGDQLWVKVVGVAGCGKSTLCEALSVNRKYVLAKSTIRGFHSGYKSDDGGDNEDNSLIVQARGKTLVTKDGDTLLQSPNLPQILSEARDLYDGTSRTHYRNTMSKDYQGVRMTWLLCGTGSLRSIDSSELGERFLDCVIMDGIDPYEEEEISWRAACQANRNMSLEANGKPESQYSPELTQAMQLTGGYVTHIREKALTDMAETVIPLWAMRRCMALGEFIACMRARPSTRQEENAERELSARLVSQLVRLAKCLALVLNRKRVTRQVMVRVSRVAMDTSRGQTLEIAKYLYKLGEEGAEVRSVGLTITRTEEQVKKLLRFMGQIGMVETFAVDRTGLHNRRRWRLTSRLSDLYEKVVRGDE